MNSHQTSDIRHQPKKDYLKRKAAKGSLWGISSNLSVSAISFVGTMVLARLLAPEDFGLLGMAVLITGVVRLFGNIGLGAALVQKKEIDDEYLSTAFWSTLIVSAGLTLISIIIAPFAAMFFEQPVVKWIIIWLSTTFIITAISGIHRTLLYKDIKIKKMAIIEVVSRFVRVIIIVSCALLGMGVWSIVIGMIAEGVLKTILFIFTSHWVPSMQFNKTKFKELFHFGRNIYGQGFLGYFSRNVDFIITGRLLGAALLGFYQFSYNIPHLIRTFVQDGIGPVVFPVFSKVNDDKNRMARGLFTAINYISMLAFPLMFGLAFCASDFIAIVYGAKWLPAVQPLQLLCISASLSTVHFIVGYVFSAVGKPEIGLKWGLFILPVTIISVMLFSRWGITGVAGAMVFVQFIGIYMVVIATKLLGVKFINYLSSLKPAIVCSLAMVAGLYLFSNKVLVIDNIYFRLMSNVLVGGLLYVITLFILFKKEFLGAMEFISFIAKKN